MVLAVRSRLGPYEIVAPLGAGGMGEVYRARDIRLGRDVALKVLPAGRSHDPDLLRRFEQEARATAALNHANVVALYDVGTHEGQPYLVTELLEGETLRERLDQGPMAPRQVFDVAIQIARGLAAAHAKSIVHRDLKPENLFVTQDGTVKILDFGLAALREPSQDAATMGEVTTRADGTTPGTVLGTAGYMAPEQVRGTPADQRTDIFAFGVVLYEMLAGRRAFARGSVADTLGAILLEDPPELTSGGRPVSPAVERVVRRCLEKRPEDRFHSAHDLALALEAASSGELPVVQSRPSHLRVVHWLAVGAAVAVIVAAAVIVGTRGWRPQPHAPGAISSLAVLPFENLTRDRTQDYFVDGIHDALITALARLGSLQVTSRSTVMRYRGQQKALIDVARELGVDALVEGTILRSGDRVRVTAQLIRGDTDQHLWAHSYDRDISDVLALIDEVSGAVAREIGATVSRDAPLGTATPRPPHRVLPEAYDAFLHGQQVYRDPAFSPGKSLPAAQRDYELAIKLDPAYADAWGHLANNLAWQAIFMIRPIRDALPLVRENARLALELDEDTGSAWAALGTTNLYFDWEFTSAEQELERAVRLVPHHGGIRHAYSDYFLVMGRAEESLQQVRRASADNPDSVSVRLALGGHLLATRRYQETIDVARATAAGPLMTVFLAKALWLADRHAEAIAEYRKLWGPDREPSVLLETTFRRSGPQAAMRSVATYLAARPEAERESPTVLAGFFAQAGDRNAALAWLEKAFELRTPTLLHVPADPFLDPVRNDPRIDELCHRIGLPVDAWRGWKGPPAAPAPPRQGTSEPAADAPGGQKS